MSTGVKKSEGSTRRAPESASSGSTSPRSTATGALRPRWEISVDDYPTAIAWSRDGALLAIACGEGTVAVIDGATGARLREIEAHGNGALAIDWSAPTEQQTHGVLATAGQDGRARLWDPASGDQLAELDAGATGSATGRMHDAPRDSTGSRTVVPWCEHLTWSRNGRYLATAAGRHVRLWDRAGHLVRTHAPFAGTVNALAWRPRSSGSPSGDNLTAAGYGGAIMYAVHADNPADMDARSPMPSYESAVEHRFDWKGLFLSLAWSPTGRILVSGMQENAIHVWQGTAGANDATTYVDLEMSGYPVKVRALAWDSEGSVLATGGAPTVTVWSMAGKGPAKTKPLSLDGHASPVSHVAFYRTGKLLASGSEDGQLIVWDLVRSSKKPAGSVFHTAGVAAVAWHPSARRIVSAYASGIVSVWDVAP